jgi:Lhr-like helicase
MSTDHSQESPSDEQIHPHILSMDFELEGLRDPDTFQFRVCKAAGAYPRTINSESLPEISTSDEVLFFAARNGMEDDPRVQANRQKVKKWVESISKDKEVWLGHNFRRHDWQFLKSLDITRKPIIDTLELSLLLAPDAPSHALRKDYLNDESESEGKQSNNPVLDATEAWKKAFDKDQGLIPRMANHPLRPIWHMILNRDANASDWKQKDWAALEKCFGESEGGNGETAQAIAEKLKSLIASELAKYIDGNTPDLFCGHLNSSPFACAYFASWLYVVATEAKHGERPFAPHPFVTQHYPQVLQMIRQLLPFRLTKTPDTKTPDPSTPLQDWLWEFNPKAKSDKWDLKGRYVQVPASDACSQYDWSQLDGAPAGESTPLPGIHQADVIGRIIGVEGSDYGSRYGRHDSNSAPAFSPSGLYVAPTGFGKSLCYQLPAFMFARAWKALTVVISPLQALQADQVAGMLRANPGGIRVLNQLEAPTEEKAKFTIAFYNSAISSEERTKIRSGVRNGTVDMIFLAPEQLMSQSISDMLECRDIALLALDEAHCLCAWGQSFRPEYMYVAKWLNQFCEKRLKQLNKTSGEAKGENGNPDPFSLDRLCWTHCASVKDPLLPLPRVALLTATLEPAQVSDLQKLFNVEPSHTLGGYSPRQEIAIEVHHDYLLPPLDEKQLKYIKKTGRTPNPEILSELEQKDLHSRQKNRIRAARRLGALMQFLHEPFSKPGGPRIGDLPVLVYSVTIKQNELVFGKKAIVRHDTFHRAVWESLPFGAAQLWNGETTPQVIKEIDIKPAEILAHRFKLQDQRSVPVDVSKIPGFWNPMQRINLKGETVDIFYPWTLTFTFHPSLPANLYGTLLGLLADDRAYGRKLYLGNSELIISLPSPLHPLENNEFQHGTVALYHGRMPSEERKHIMDAFCGAKNSNGENTSSPNIILCTNAFGMGVDKPDICSVILLGMPGNLSDLLQQVGRAMRNPEKAAETITTKTKNKKKPDAKSLRARAIVLTDAGMDTRVHNFMIMRSAIHAATLDRVWRSVDAYLSELERKAKPYFSSTTSKNIRPPFNAIENAIGAGIITVTLADLRRCWTLSGHEESNKDLLTDRDLGLEAQHGLFDLDNADSEMEQRLRQCFYWLERFGYLERRTNAHRVFNFEIKAKLANDADKEAVQAVQKEIKAIDVDLLALEACKITQGHQLSSDWLAKIRAAARVQHNPAVNAFRKKTQRREHSRTLTAFLCQQISLELGNPNHERCKASNCKEADTKTLPLCLPFASETISRLLHGLLLRKICQDKEPDPAFQHMAWVFDLAEDTKLFAETYLLQNQNQEKPPFSSFKSGRSLFNHLVAMDWIEDQSSLTLLIDHEKLDNLLTTKGELPKILEYCKTFLEDPKQENKKSRSQEGTFIAKFRDLITLCGGASFSDTNHPFEYPTESEHIKAVEALLDAVSSITEKLASEKEKSGIIRLNAKDYAQLECKGKLSILIQTLKGEHDPMFRHTARSFVIAVIHWLQHWYQDAIQVVHNKAIMTEAYTLRLLQRVKEDIKPERNVLAPKGINWIPTFDGEESGPDLHHRRQNGTQGSKNKAPTASLEDAFAKLDEILNGKNNIFTNLSDEQKKTVDRLRSRLKERKAIYDKNNPEEKSGGKHPIITLVEGDDEYAIFEHHTLDFMLKDLFRDELMDLSKSLDLDFLANYPAPCTRLARADVLLRHTLQYKHAQVRFLKIKFLPEQDEGKRSHMIADYYRPGSDLLGFRNYRIQDEVMKEVHDEDGNLLLPLPSDEQIAFIEDPDPFCLLQAGPGTGKTATLIRKLLWLVEVDRVEPEKICFIAFNVAVVKEIKRKVKAAATILGLPDLNKIWIGTCHSLMRKINGDEENATGNHDATISNSISNLKKSFELFATNEGIPFVTPKNSNNRWIAFTHSQVIRFLDEHNSVSKASVDLKQFVEVFGRCKNNEMGNKFRDLFTQTQLKLDDAQNQKYQIGFLRNDSTDSSSSMPPSFIYSHILIDEVQDIADISKGKDGPGTFLRTLVRFAQENCGGANLEKVIAAGDEDQGIYDYNGGSGDFMKDFRKLCEKPQTDSEDYIKFITPPTK